MKYNATIEYTGNVERAGKLTLTNENGDVILSKVPVAMPDEIFTAPKLFEKIHSSRSVQIKMDEELRKFDKSNAYDLSYGEVIKNNTEGFFIKSIGKILIKPTNDKKMKNDDHCFVMHKEHFEVLFDVLSKKNQLEIQTEKVSFLWFPEKVINANGNINITLENFENVESKIRNKKEDAERITALEAAQKKAKVNTGITKPKLSEAVDNIAKIVNQESKKNTSTNQIGKTPIQNVHQNVQNKQSVIQVLPTRNSRENNDIDALDILLMYSNPELAPFIKPSSPLAWYLYFNHQASNIDKNYIEQNVNKVQGFENVATSNFEYTQNGYNVKLFDNNSNFIGNIEFNQQKNSYELSHNNEKNVLLLGDNGNFKMQLESGNGHKTMIDLVQTEQGFLGNWTADNNGVQVNSSITFNNDLEYKSNPSETINLNTIVPIVVNDYNNTINQTLGYETKQEKTFEFEREYTPPPPPPKNDEVWSSSDPYSNGSSFRM